MRATAIVAAVFLLLFLILANRGRPHRAPSPPPASPSPPTPEREGVPDAEPYDASRVVLRGMVLDRDTSAPLAGAEVILSADEGEVRTTTNDGGEFSFPVPREASSGWWLEARRERYATGSVYWSTEAEAPYLTGRPPIRLAAYAATLAGRVVDLDDRPVPGARIHLSDGRELRADELGRFGPVPVPTGRMGCDALSAGHPITERFLEFAAGEAQEVTIVLGATHFVRGVVVDGAGRPVPGAEVSAGYSADGEAAITDAEGRFRWPVAPGRTTRLYVEKPGWVQERPVPDVLAGSRTRLTVFRPLTVAGRVVDAGGGPPPAGLHVAIGAWWWDDLRPDGSFEIRDQIPGICLLEVRRTKDRQNDIVSLHHLFYTALPVELRPGESREDLVVQLPPLVLRTGRFRDAITGRPIPGVRFLGVVSDGEGRFAVPMRPTDGELDRAVAEGYVPAVFEVSAPGGEATFELVPVARIRCRVVDTEGQPVPGAWVRVDVQADAEWEGWADANGNASVRAYPGPMEIRIHRADAGTAAWHGTAEARPGAVLDLGTVTLSPVPEHLDPVRIQVVDDTGHPVPGARCEEDRADENGVLVVDRWRFPLTVVAPGRAEGFLRRVPDDATEVTVVLAPGGEVRGRVIDSAGRPVRGAHLHLDRVWTMTDIRGRFEYAGLELGRTYLLNCRPDYWPNRVREVRAGDEVEWRLPPWSAIRVRFRGRTAAAGFGRPEFTLSDPTSGDVSPFFDASYESRWRFDGATLLIDAPVGTFDLDLRMTGGGEAGWFRYAGIRVRAGRETEVDYAYPTPGRITGRVRTVDGDTINDAAIRIADTRAQVAATAADGEIRSRLEIEDRSHCLGPRHLRIEADGFAPLVVGPHDLCGTVDLDVRLSPGVEFCGRVLPAPGDGKPTRVRIRPPIGIPGSWKRVESDGRVALGWVAPGRHRVEVRRPDRIPVTFTVDVRADGEGTIDTRACWGEDR